MFCRTTESNKRFCFHAESSPDPMNVFQFGIGFLRPRAEMVKFGKRTFGKQLGRLIRVTMQNVLKEGRSIDYTPSESLIVPGNSFVCEHLFIFLYDLVP